MSARLRRRTPSPKTVTFDPSPPTTLERMRKYYRFKNHREWEQYLNALLADLQNTVSPGSGSSGYGSLNTSRARQSPGSEISASKVDAYGVRSGTYGKTQPTSGARSPGYHGGGGYASGPEKRTFNNNLSELDTLLQDLSNSRYANTSENGMNGTLNGTYNGSGGLSPGTHSRPSSAQSTLNRRTVDSLLDELNSGSNDDFDKVDAV